MIADINLGGVLLPGLLVVALVAIFCTMVLLPILALSRFYLSLPWRPLIELATYITIFALLIPGLNMLV